MTAEIEQRLTAALAVCTGVTFDSRQVKPGMLYVALKGEHADGHAYVTQALEKGAARALVRADWAPPQGVDEDQLVRVPDTRLGFGDAARIRRQQLSIPVVGITGSAGKTTVKELTAAFLRAGGLRVAATAGNFNNDLGLPLTILNCPQDAQVLVLEMGTNHPGEIQYLADIARPNVGLISSIGTAHIEFFKTQEGIAVEKGTLLKKLTPHAQAPFCAVLAEETNHYATLCALSTAPIETVSDKDPASAAFAQALAVRLPGIHNVRNALIAYGCARRFGVSLAACLKALENFTLPGGRWRVVEHKGITYIDDTYNANPTSMAVAVETFASLPSPLGRRIVVLGDMFELGEQTAAYHVEILEKVRAYAFDKVVFVGSNFREAAGRRPDCALGCVLAVDALEAHERLAAYVQSGDRVLVKASHGMFLSRVIPS